jgi:hypothetical protein
MQNTTRMIAKSWAAVLIALIMPAWGLPAGAQDQKPGHTHPLIGDLYDAHTAVHPVAVAGKTAAQTANIQVTYINFPPNARNAFQYAVDIWEAHLASPVTIRVEARWESLEDRVLGAAGPTTFFSMTNAPFPNTWYPVALAHAINGQRFTNAPEHDIRATLSSNINWYFGTDARPPSGTYDLVTVALHEIGHGIGFFDSFRVDEGEDADFDACPGVGAGFGCWGYAAQAGGAPLPIVFDRFVEDSQGRSLLNTSIYPNPSITLGNALQSDAIFFGGPTTRAFFADIPVNLYAPASFEPASSIAHLDEATFPAGDPNSLMTPRLAFAEAIHSPGGIFCGILDDIGWGLGPGCMALLQQEILAFTATIESTAAGRVRLNWTIADDAEVDRFVIEARHFDDPFIPVAEVNAVAGQRQYTIEIDGLEPGRHQFRVRYVRTDQTEGISQQAEVNLPMVEEVIITGPYPNPVRDRATLYVQVRRAQDVNVRMYDAMGRLVDAPSRRRIQATGRETYQIEAGVLAAGVYFLMITGTEFQETRRLVVVK